VLHCVFAVWYTEAKLKVEAFEEPVAEVVLLDHTELVDGLVTHRELYAERSNRKVSQQCVFIANPRKKANIYRSYIDDNYVSLVHIATSLINNRLETV